MKHHGNLPNLKMIDHPTNLLKMIDHPTNLLKMILSHPLPHLHLMTTQ
jgi:hypothetical protein